MQKQRKLNHETQGTPRPTAAQCASAQVRWCPVPVFWCACSIPVAQPRPTRRCGACLGALLGACGGARRVCPGQVCVKAGTFFSKSQENVPGSLGHVFLAVAAAAAARRVGEVVGSGW